MTDAVGGGSPFVPLYDPRHPDYVDEASVRTELSRVFDVCQGCRACVDFCGSFPTLFDLVDRHDDRDVGRLTPAEQDAVVDECFQCKRCAVNCPYTPDLHELRVDVPRLMLRANAMRHRNRLTDTRDRIATRVLGRTDVVGRLATTRFGASIANAPAGSMLRRLASGLAGLAGRTALPRFATQRFSEWFRQRPKLSIGHPLGQVVVYPTCVVEYQAPQIGKDLVKVYERNGIECECSSAGCCGAPSLVAGDIARFAKIAERNVRILAGEVRGGRRIVVGEPACAHTLKQDYLEHAAPSWRSDAELVADATSDASEYLMTLHHSDDNTLDTSFAGSVPRSISYSASSHLRAPRVGFKGRDLLKLTGAPVRVVRLGSGFDGMWGVRRRNEKRAAQVVERLVGGMRQTDGATMASDGHLAATAIAAETGGTVVHPLQIVARAYGITEET